MKKFNKSGGFTLIELLVVIGIIAILAAIVIVSINPAKRFQDARNAQRQANVESILNALQQRIVDNKGILPTECGITGNDQEISNSGADLADVDCIRSYLAVLPYDPSADDAGWTSESVYNTKYEVRVDASTKQITVSAPESDDDGVATEISVTR